MTRNKDWFISFNDEVTTEKVTFGDGKKAKILARGSVCAPGIPELKNVLYVDDLTANLISVSQLTNDYEDVWFTKHCCLVFDNAGSKLMQGKRAVDNCYHTSDIASNSLCLSVKSSNSLTSRIFNEFQISSVLKVFQVRLEKQTRCVVSAKLENKPKFHTKL